MVSIKLNIISWNANSVKGKMGELKEFLYEAEVDILLIQETFLKPTDPLKVPNYNIYRNDRLTGRGGGTAVIIKRNIEHHRLETPPITGMEATVIEARTGPADVKII